MNTSRPPVPVPDLARRRPVWLALAELYLDTEPTDADLRHLAGTLAASGYGRAALRAINYDEVAPLLLSNLLQVAGEWRGWEPAALAHALAARYTGRPHRLLGSRRLWRGLVDYCVAELLNRLLAYLP